MKVHQDQEIIDAILKGKNEAILSVLYKKVLPKIKGYITKNGGHIEDVKDVFQDAVIIFINHVKMRKFDKSKDIDGFIYTVARNLWINKVKSNKRTVLTDTHEDTRTDNEHYLRYLIDKEKEAAVFEILDALGEPCAQLLRHTIIQELSLKEVAEKMNYSSAEIAKTYNYRCKKRLTGIIKENKYYQKILGKKL